MTRLWLVRHGETDWNNTGRYQGQADPPLNANGLAQAQRIGGLLAGELLAKNGIEAIYSSDLQRALHTAQIIGEKLKLPVQVDLRLREVSLGKWEGMLVGEIRAAFPQEWQARQEDPLYARPPGGESLVGVAERVWEALDQIVRHHPDGGVVIVSHGLALASILCRAGDIPLAQAYHMIPDNAVPVKVDWPKQR